MYLHLGQETVITTDSIVAMFDIDACTVSKKTRDFLAAAQKNSKIVVERPQRDENGEVVNVSFELPRSFVVCRSKGKTTVYISQLSTKTLQGREFG